MSPHASGRRWHDSDLAPPEVTYFERFATCMKAIDIALDGPILRTDEARKAIRDAILRGAYRGGDRLIEDELAPMLGVSKTPVREALRALGQSGLVILHPHRGAVVRVVDQTMVREVYGVRMLLEPEAVRVGTKQQTARELAALRRILRDAQREGAGGDYPAMSASNRAFHLGLAGPCRNSILLSMLDTLQDQVALISITAWQRRSTCEQEQREHEGILRAVEEKD